jgi:phosphoribosylamine--glycine ligase
MNILVLGKGGREHALAWKLSLENSVEQVWVYPGNPGMKKTPKVLPLTDLTTEEFDLFLINHKIELVVVGPEDLIANGTGEKLRTMGLNVFAPTPEAAKLESSKIFSKEMMKKSNIPTALAEMAYSLEEALSKLNLFPDNDGVVIKLSGLHAGKGVIVCETKQDAIIALNEWKDLLNEGVLLEEKLVGQEVSLFYICLDEEALYLGEACDHKRLLDGDQGPNTGGMGCYSPCYWIEKDIRDFTKEEVVKPLLKTMKKNLTPFNGILFVGLMVTNQGPKVLEFNVRFGDPETQTFLPLIKDGLLDALLAVSENDLAKFKKQTITHHEQTSLHVVKSARGYPEKPVIGDEVFITDELTNLYFFAGVKEDANKKLITAGGRICGLTVIADSIQHANTLCYQQLSQVTFKGEFFRKDIGGLK